MPEAQTARRKDAHLDLCAQGDVEPDGNSTLLDCVHLVHNALPELALEEVELTSRAGHRPNQLSGGQRQRVAIARALVTGPSILLADEPTGNLHSDQGREIMRLFKKLNDEGTTIVQVTHSEENASYGHRVVRLRDGWIVND